MILFLGFTFPESKQESDCEILMSPGAAAGITLLEQEQE